MDPAAFIATTLASAVLKEITTDTYKALKSRLVKRFGLGSAVEAVEQAPEDQDAHAFLAAKVSKTGAVDDTEVATAITAIAAELAKLPDATPLTAKLTVQDIKADLAEFRRIRVGGGASTDISRIDARTIRVEDINVGDDRKQ